MKFGLEQHIIDKLITVFEQHPKVDKALVFGSRAKGNYRLDSDIDIAIKGKDLNTDDIIAISVAFEEKGINHKIDLINYHSIKEPDFKDHIDRVGIELFSRWEESKLGDYIETINGFAFKSTDFLGSEKPNSLPIIKIKNVANGDVNIDGVHYHLYSDNLKKYVVEKGDILISLTGNHPELETQVVGLVSKYKLETKALLNQRVGKLFSKKPKEFNDNYLYYFLKNKDTHQYLASQSSGSANQANISKTDIEKISFSKPPIEEQNAIAAILSSLDDKIDLLLRQNKTLEQLAETLFRQWFVKEEDWLGTLSEFVKVQGGYAFKSKDFRESGFAGIIKITNISMGFVDINKCDYVDEKAVLNLDKKFKIRTGDFLIAMTGAEIGKIGIVENTNKEIWLNQRVGKLEAKVPYGNLIGYLALKSREGQDHIINACSGSAQENISTTGIEEMVFAKYDEEKAISFGKEASHLFEKITTNYKQIKTLSQTRDTLLPKLMSGEVRVKM